MEERTYERRLDEAFSRIENAFDDVDPDAAEVARSGDTLTIAFRDGVRLIVSPQRPLSQIWVATKASGYRFRWDDDSAGWIEESGRAGDLFSVIVAEARAHGAVEVQP